MGVPGIGIVVVMVNVLGQVNGRFARKLCENSLDAVSGCGAGEEQNRVGVVHFEPRNNGVGFVHGGGVIVPCDKDCVAVEVAEAHEVVQIEFCVAAVAQDAAPENQDGIGFAASHEFGGHVDAFHVGGLSVEHDDPADMFEFVIVDKPMTALGHHQVEGDDEEYGGGRNGTQNDFLFLDLFLGG